MIKGNGAGLYWQSAHFFFVESPDMSPVYRLIYTYTPGYCISCPFG
ncbi:hypothetical protein A343_1439 [Porphyromonas gingivalis JCVI SC001]|nr:hypothetical protein A343_1439 [Porphyromonas gingivalis JCVI SC001]